MTMTQQTLLCILPPTATSSLLLSTIERKQQVYPVQMEARKLDEQQFELTLEGLSDTVEKFGESLRDQVGSWGGRVHETPQPA